MCFKKHVEKVHGIEQSYNSKSLNKGVKAQVAIRVVLKKVNQNTHFLGLW